MKKCIICEIINTPQHLEDTIIYENDFFVVKAAKGMVVPGHIFKVIAEQEGVDDDYEWREEKNNSRDKLVKTIELGKNIIK